MDKKDSVPKQIFRYALGAFCVYWIYDIYRNFYGNYEPKWMYYVAGLFAAAYASKFLKPGLLYSMKKYALRAFALFFAIAALTVTAVHTKDFATFAASCLAWYLVGDFFIGLFALDISRAEKLTFSMASGMVIFSYILLAMGIPGMFGATHLWGAVIIVVAALGIRKLPRSITAIKEKTAACARAASKIESVVCSRNTTFALALAAALMFVVVAAADLAPPTLIDDLIYHLSVPKIWARNGAVIPIHWVGLPFSLEILCAQGMAMGSEYIFAGLTNITFAVLLLASFVVIGRRFFGGAAVGITAFLFLFSVIYYILHLFSFSTDMKFLIFVLLAFHCFLAWAEEKNIRWLLLCAAMTGFSMGFRYHGVVLAAFLAVVALSVMMSSGKDSITGIAASLAAFCVIVAATGFPWCVKNLIEMGNPVWPAVIGPFNFWGDADMSYFYKLAGDPNFPISFGYYGFGTSWDHLVKLPWKLTFAGGNYEGYAFTPAYLAFIPFVFTACRRRKNWIPVFFALFYTAIWFRSMQQMKFLIPTFAILGLVAADGVYSSAYFRKPFFKRLFLSLLLFPAIYSIKNYYASPGAFADKLPVVFRKELKDSYLSGILPYHNFVLAANKILPDDAYVFVPVDKRLFYFDRNYFIAEGNIQIAVDYRTMSDFSDLIERIRRLGITHMIDVKGNGDKLVYPHFKAPNGVAENIIFSTKNEKYLKKLHEDPCGWILYEIKYPVAPPSRARRPMNPELIGDDFFIIGWPDMAKMQYVKAVDMGYSSSASKIRRLDSMTHEDRGDYYLNLVNKHKADRFLKFARDEYIKAHKTDASRREIVAAKIDEVYSTGLRIAPHIWNHAPKIKLNKNSR